MLDRVSRRQFLAASALLPAAGVRGAMTFPRFPGALAGRSQRSSHVRLSCNLYSFNRLLRSGEMSLEEVIEFCGDLNFDAVDPTGYYFGTYPDVPDDAYIHQIKRRAFLLGLDISGTGVRNDFATADRAERAAGIDRVKRWVKFAAKLGAPVLRVFAGDRLPEGESRQKATDRLVEALEECAAYGGRHGVMIVLQNHAEFLETADQVIDVLEAVDSDWLGLNLDIGSFPSTDPYREIAKAAPYAVTWQIKENVTLAGGRQEKTDLDRLVQIVRDVGYRGYLPLETLGPGDPREKVPRFLAEVRRALG